MKQFFKGIAIVCGGLLAGFSPGCTAGMFWARQGEAERMEAFKQTFIKSWARAEWVDELEQQKAENAKELAELREQQRGELQRLREEGEKELERMRAEGK